MERKCTMVPASWKDQLDESPIWHQLRRNGHPLPAALLGFAKQYVKCVE